MNHFCFRLALCYAGMRVSGLLLLSECLCLTSQRRFMLDVKQGRGYESRGGQWGANLMVLGEAWRTSSSPFLLLSPDSLQLSRSWCDPLLCGDYSCAVQPLSKLELYLFFSADLCCLILLKIEMHWKWLSSYKCGNIRVDIWGYKSIKLPFEHWLSR